MDHSFEVEGLREEVREGKGFERVTTGEKCTEIASESGGIAGDISDLRRGDGGEEGCDFRAEAGARRVEDDEVGWLRFEFAAEKGEGAGRFGCSRDAAQIVGECGGGGGRGFDGDHVCEVCGKLTCEKADAGVEVPCELARAAIADAMDERVEEPAIDLKECAVVDAIVEAGGAVEERVTAGGCEAAQRLVVSGLDEELEAGELGDLLAEGGEEIVG
jgi:hypothetical protein